MNLYELNAEISAFEPEIDEDTGELLNAAELDALNLEREQKIENICLYIKNLSAEADAIKAEAKNLAERQRAKEKKRDGLLRYLESALAGAPFETAKCKVSYRKSKRVDVDDEFLGWAILHRTDLVRYSAPQPNKDEIKRCLAKGDSLAGVAPEIEHARLVDVLIMSVK